MTLHKDDSGRRWVEAEVEVPGTPEEVWQSIATGPGISCWFVPTAVEGHEGGAVRANFGPGMDSLSTVTAWEPPRRFVAESADLGPEAPPLATEWSVEARDGGVCVVRVVHSLFASTDDWDGQLEGFEYGWPAFFRILRLYLTHFRGQGGAAFQLMGVAREPTIAAWDALVGALGLAGAAEGQRVRSAADAPPLAGRVEHAGPSEYPGLHLRLDAPTGGIAHLFALPMGGQVFLPIRLYLYGDQAPAVVARDEPVWQAWIAGHFPMGS
ncbi:MAG TPA: SRPBCC domain-containing protein [Chloroflexota bacterium]|jgi:uncharacterized protein YndB with AHSA1/START domain